MSGRKQLEYFEHCISPMLEVDEFVSSNGMWLRSTGLIINCVELQLKGDKQACCVNLGVHFTFIPPVGKSQLVAISELSQPECEIKSRLAWQGEADHWWSFGDAQQQATDMISCYEQEGRPFFHRFSQFPHPFADIELGEIATETTAAFFPGMTKVRMVLLLARIHDHLGHRDKVLSLCNFGIEVAGMASGPKAAFRDLLRKYGS